MNGRSPEDPLAPPATAYVDPRRLQRTDAMHVWLAGSGAWLGEAAARRCGLPSTRLSDRLGDAARVLPALGVATLLVDRSDDRAAGARCFGAAGSSTDADAAVRA